MEDLFEPEEETRVKVGSRRTTVYSSSASGERFFFIPRHLLDHSVAPHNIDFRSNLEALKALGVDRVIATSAVGSISGKLAVGGLGLLDQFIDLSSRRVTVFEREPVHVDMTSPYDAGLQRAIKGAARSLRMPLSSDLVYVSVDGPRYETAAEIRMFALIGGDVVGMTGAPEAIVARELGIRYASIVIATNLAAGLQERVAHEEVVSAVGKAKPMMKRLIEASLPRTNRT